MTRAPDFTAAVGRLIPREGTISHEELTAAIRQAAPTWAAIALRDPRLMAARVTTSPPLPPRAAEREPSLIEIARGLSMITPRSET